MATTETQTPLSVADIISALGGRSAVARLTRSNPNNITQWLRNGVPARYWHVLAAEAERREVSGITIETLQRSRPPVPA